MKNKLLFLCTGNSCRSQMAEGLLRSYKGDKYESYSAGTNPTMINPKSIQVMSEIGIDISGQKSQDIEEFKHINLDTVVTVCDNAKESCPVLPQNVKVINWSFEDPADAVGGDEEVLNKFREIRNEIKERIVNEL